MNAVIKEMADQHDVTFGWHVRGLVRRDERWMLIGEDAAGEKMQAGPFDAVVVSIPPEQASAIVALHDLSLAATALAARSQPCWTGMFAFSERLPAKADTVREEGLISWAARNGAKPGRKGPETWVVQASPHWSMQHIDDTVEQVSAALLAALGEALEETLPEPVTAAAHRWRYAMSTGSNLGALWSAQSKIGVCGDWLLGPRVENAWISGRTLATRMMAREREEVA
jgi:predicted NAD/FAD-dependent oxidoreductase